MPRSTLFPSLGMELLSGIKLLLKEQGLSGSVEWITDNIGFGTNEAEIYAKAEKMLLQEEVDLVILCVDTLLTEMLQPLFTASGKILLAVNFGANFPENWTPAPTSVTHSLNFSFHTWLTGKLAAKETDGQSVNVISFYEAGYRQCFSMLNGHQKSGGQPLFNHVTKLRPEEFTLEPAIDFLQANAGIKNLLCQFSGPEAEQFYRAFAPLQKSLDLNFYVNPMMLVDAFREKMGEGFSIANVKGYIPWHASLANAANERFIKTIAASGHTANLFYLLGWETGILLQEIIRQRESGLVAASAIVNELKKGKLESPRGWLKVDPGSQYSFGPAYLATWKEGMELSVSSELAGVETEWDAFRHVQLDTPDYAGWRNTYLCI